MVNLIPYLMCGDVIRHSRWETVEFKVNKFLDIYEKIIPFLKENPVLGEKSKDFADWWLVSEMIKEKNIWLP